MQRSATNLQNEIASFSKNRHLEGMWISYNKGKSKNSKLKRERPVFNCQLYIVNCQLKKGKPIGPMQWFAVAPGDTIRMEAYAHYEEETVPQTAT